MGSAVPSNVINTLYNNNGTLYFNGNTIGSSGGNSSGNGTLNGYQRIITAGISTSSGQVEMTGSNLTVPITSGKVLITATIPMSNTAVQRAGTYIVIDGTVVSAASSSIAGASYQSTNTMTYYASNLSVGNHTFGLQWGTTGGTLSLFNDATLQVLDLGSISGNVTASQSQWTTTGSNIYYNSGNIGIGTNTPSSLLTVAGNVNLNNSLYVNSSSSNVGIGTSSPSSLLTVNGNVNLNNTLYVNSTSGYVGIGTSSPTQPLHVIATTPDDNGGIIKYENTNSTGTVDTADAQLLGKNRYGTLQNMVWQNLGGRIGMRAATNSSGDLYFTSGNDSVFMVGKANGNVGIGTSSPNGKLSVKAKGGSGNDGLTVESNSDANHFGYINDNGVNVMVGVTSNSFSSVTFAYFTTGAGAWSWSSDARLKNNITTLNSNSDLQKVLALRPVEFDWKNGDGHQVGFVAQEVQKVLPDIVTNNSNGYLGVAKESMIPYMVGATQEQQKQIQSQQSQIQNLTQENQELKSQNQNLQSQIDATTEQNTEMSNRLDKLEQEIAQMKISQSVFK